MQRPTRLHLGTQYYRAPFPEQRYWADDLSRMRDHGLDTVQFWVLWAWVEAVPGCFRWEDYDRLISLAEERGLHVVLSTIAEIQPYWIHREVPGCELVNHHGQPVRSVNRGECHFGCTPGGCTDHPEVWRRMQTFLRAVTERYHSAANLVGWDVWNELRWNIEAEGRCCYCAHTVARYHDWLRTRHGDLDSLNAAWKRRYGDWSEVWPGRQPGLPYTDTMPWLHFLTERANRHARDRYELVKAIDPARPVTVHGGQPSPGYVGNQRWTALDRGNDWAFAEHLDGVGCSSFPKWLGMDDADFAVRVEHVASAAGDKRVWLSEVQGGRASQGLQVHEPVTARDQQRWIWNGYACGADTILFWCWRDEVFGRESAGFGIDGRDGLAEERLGELAVTGAVLHEHAALLAGYRPDPAAVGLLFSPQSYYYYWAQEGSAWQAGKALDTWCRALVRQAVPYTVLEEAHLAPERLAGLRLIVLPRTTALPLAAEAALADWVRSGGILLVESECGAFSPEGLYRYPGDRFLAELAGIVEVGRRRLQEGTINLHLEGKAVPLRVNQWLTPLAGPATAICHAPHADGSLLLESPAGAGRVIALGTYAGDPADRSLRDDPGHEALVAWALARAGVRPEVRVVQPAPASDTFIHLRSGRSGAGRLLFAFAPPGVGRVELEADATVFAGRPLQELRGGGQVLPQRSDDGWRLELEVPAIGFAVLAEVEAL